MKWYNKETQEFWSADTVYAFVECCIDGSCPEDYIDDYIDNCYDRVEIAGIKFYPSQIVKECDLILYEEIERDYEDMVLERCKEELNVYEPEKEGMTLYDFLEDCLDWDIPQLKEIIAKQEPSL